MRWSAAGLAAIVMAACSGAAVDGRAAEAAQAESGQPVATAVMQPALPPASPPPPIGPATFIYDGELTQGGWIRGQAPAGTVTATLSGQALVLDDDGHFFAAFDRDAGSSETLIAQLANGRSIESPIAISLRKWDIERVNTAKRPSGSSEAWWKRREPEYNAIVAARAKKTGAAGWRQDFIWPATGRISGRFGRQRIYRGEPGSYHSGVDVALPTGTPFVAPADGVVVLARMGFSLEGGLIIIDHGQGLNSAFLHANRIVVKEGDAVKQGQHIGDVGSTGRSTGPHLHWGLKWNDARFDPILLAGPMR